MNTDQIAAEALRQIQIFGGPSVQHPSNLAIIKAAIEKAVAQLIEERDAWKRNSLHQAGVALQESRAASEEEILENERMVKGRTKAGDELRAAQESEQSNTHIEHYFPKGYNPDAEPWKSIKAFHRAAIQKAYEAGQRKLCA